MFEKLISLIFCSEILHDKLINVLYLFCSDLLLFSKKIGKIVHDAKRYKMVDIKRPIEYQHENFAPQKCKSKFAFLRFVFFVWEVLANYFSRKPAVSI